MEKNVPINWVIEDGTHKHELTTLGGVVVKSTFSKRTVGMNFDRVLCSITLAFPEAKIRLRDVK